MDCVGNYCYLDGEILPAEYYDDAAAAEVSFYEVIRTRGGDPFFFDDHIERLKEGISTRYDLPPNIAEEIRDGLTLLTGRESFDEINVRVTVSFTGYDHSLHICYVDSHYPTETMRAEGVRLIAYHAERLDPEVKTINTRLRMAVNAELKRRDAYEALLVTRDGFITEGSRSNVFFISGNNEICTAPDNMVLAGITRRYIIQIVASEGLTLLFKPVREEETGLYKSAFLTGTSPMILAVSSIEDTSFDPSHPVVTRLQERYARLMEQSISRYKLGT